jgi:hypothetical protein
MEPMVWTKEGMTMWEWRELPLKEKIRILKKHGFKTPVKRPAAPPFSGSYLLDAYFRHVADDETVRYNFPWAVLSCGHNI